MVEPEPQRLDVEDRLVTRARWKDPGDSSEAVVEIFDPRRPVRRDCDLGAEAERPAGAREQDLVLIAGDAGSLAEARLRPGKPAGAVDQPMIERVAEATAQRRDVIDLVGNCCALGRSSGENRAVLEKIRERNIGFDPEQQAGRQNVIVACLQAAIEAAERIARSYRVRIGQRAVRAAQTIGDVTADIEASPVIIPNRRRP